MVTNIEAQTDENKAKITALDKAIQERLNDKAHVIVEGNKGEPKDGLNTLLRETVIFRSNLVMLSPMIRSQSLKITSRHMYMMISTLVWI